MNFEQGYLYHVYNQGNNRNNIFYKPRNYHFFLEKMKTFLLPYADILAYCLMPNHFHWMIYVNELELGPKNRTINDSIGILLRSYTRAINIQENFSGSLFRKQTKAICLNKTDGNSIPYFDRPFGTTVNINAHWENYPKNCFDYIHNNPVQASLVRHPKDWLYSSYPEIYFGYGNHLEAVSGLINHDKIKELELKPG